MISFPDRADASHAQELANVAAFYERQYRQGKTVNAQADLYEKLLGRTSIPDTNTATNNKRLARSLQDSTTNPSTPTPLPEIFHTPTTTLNQLKHHITQTQQTNDTRHQQLLNEIDDLHEQLQDLQS